MLIWLVGLAGCGRPATDDLADYAAVVAQREPDPKRDFAVCARISDPNLAGDCALVVAQRGAQVRRQPPDTWCDEVPSGLWRWECWFQAAESERRSGREQVAAALCQKSGPFQNDCAQHLWQTRVHRLIHGRTGQAPAFAENLSAARKIYNEWAPFLAESSDMEARFWEKYYQNGFEGAGRVALAWCDGLTEADHARCTSAAKDLVIREMAPNLDRANAWSAFCALEAPTSADVAPWFRFQPDAELDALVAERHAVLCRPGAPGSAQR